MPSANLEERIELLRARAFQPEVVYDIGAYKGDCTRRMRTIFPEARYCLFEANEEHRAELEDAAAGPSGTGSGTVAIGVLGDKAAKTATFYTRGSTGDSLYKEQTPWYNASEAKQVPVRPLDAVAAELELPPPDLVFLDVQGAETLIMRGGAQTLGHAQVIVMNVKVLPYNKDAPLLAQTIAYMSRIGFVVADVTGLHYTGKGSLNEVDVLFLRKGSLFMEAPPY